MEQRCVLVPLGDATYGVPLRQLLGVEPLARLVPLPNVPPWLLGVTYRQGMVLSVVDLGALLQVAPALPEGGEARLLVAVDGDLTVALAVPAVTEVRVVAPEQVQPAPPVSTSAANRFLGGVVAQGDQPFGLLDMARLLRSPEFLSLS